MSLIFCACGCGGQFEEFLNWRKRKYIKGHCQKGLFKKNQHLSPKTEFKKGSIPHNKGKKGLYICSEKTKEKISESITGEKHYNWQGGITPLYIQIRKSEKYLDWRTQIFGRDNFTCQHCNMRGTWLEAHHIKRFSNIIKDNNIKSLEEALICDELWDLNNGITLCKECHNKTKNKRNKI